MVLFLSKVCNVNFLVSSKSLMENIFGSGYFPTQNPKLFCTSLQEKMSKSDPRRLMSFAWGFRLCIFSRDEAKKSRLW